MREENDLKRINYLRFAIAALTAMATVLCFLGAKRYLDWRDQQQAQSNTATGQTTALVPKLDLPPKVKVHEFKRTAPAATPPHSAPTVVAAPPPPSSAPVVVETAPASTKISVSAPGALPPVSVTNGTITGHVRLHGTPPPEKTIDPLANDAICGKFYATPPRTRFYIVSPDAGLANVFVYLKEGISTGDKPGVPRGKKRPIQRPSRFDSPSLLLEQTNCLFEPYVSGVVTGTPFEIRNDDPVLHNVHATPSTNTEFNFAQPVQGQVNQRIFTQPEILVRIKCDVHPWMFAYIGAVDHPYFAVTDANGEFTITNVPPGDYTIEAVHPKAGRQTRDVASTANDVERIDFHLSAR